MSLPIALPRPKAEPRCWHCRGVLSQEEVDDSHDAGMGEMLACWTCVDLAVLGGVCHFCKRPTTEPGCTNEDAR